jgi:group II intron reverse transcriptase/maturase
MSSPTLSTRFQQIAEQASDKARVFTTLAHLIDRELLLEAFGQLRKDAAPGVDGQTAEAYAADLDLRLGDLHERLRSQQYRATPALRVWIPKEDGSQRPLAIPILEDKIVQRAVVLLLTPIYEQDFYEFSYGYRPKRGAHAALHALREHCMELGGVWLVDADVQGFFDSVPHGQLQQILRQRVNDGGIVRLVGKWLKAGILEGGSLTHPETGTPQGGVLSPLLANIYLHTVLDEWFAQQVQPRLRGRSFLIRFADDFIVGCELEDDARRVLEVLAKRLAKYGLSLHPEKTRLVQFRRPPRGKPPTDGNGTFDFLGFTHHWALSRRGFWVIKRRTARKRMQRSMRAISQWCKRNRHKPMAEQSKHLGQKLRGHYGYYGITGNFRALETVFQHTRQAWRKWLSRRSWKSYVSWEKFLKLEKVFDLPAPRIVHANV